MKKFILLILTIVCSFLLVSCDSNDIKDIVKDNNDEKIKEVFSGINFDNVTGNLFLPTKANGYVYTYQSSDESVLTTSGVVTRGDETVTVYLVITGTNENDPTDYLTYIQSVTIIKKDSKTDPEKEDPVIPTGTKTVSDIINIMKDYTAGQFSTEEYTLTGKVTSSSYNSTFGSYTCYLEAPSGYTFQVYSAKLGSSITNTYTETDALKGAVIIVTGYLKLHQNKDNSYVYEVAYVSSTGSSPIISSIVGGTPDGGSTPVDPTPTTEYTPVDSVSVGTKYTYVVEHKGISKTFFIEGSMINNYYYKTTTTFASAAVITLETANGGYYVKIGSKYANVTSDSNHDTVYMETTGKTVWTFNASAHTMVCTVNSKTFVLGCRSGETYETIRAVEFGKGHYEGYLTLSTGGSTPVDPTPSSDLNGDTTVHTVAEIIALMSNMSNGEVSGGKYTVKGIVESSTYDSTHKSYSMYLEAPSGKTFQVYSAVLGAGLTGDYTKTDALKGEEVVVTGYLKLFYNSKTKETIYEIAYDTEVGVSPVIESISSENFEEVVSYDTLAEMIEAIKAQNYLLSYTMTYDYREDDDYDGSVTYLYYFGTDKVMWTVSEEGWDGETYDYTYYVVKMGEDIIGIYEDDNGDWATCEYDSEEYSTYIEYYGGFYGFDFSLLTVDNLTKVSDGKYKLAASVKNQFAIGIAGDATGTDEEGEYTETFNDVFVYVNDGLITKIEFSSLYVEHYFETEEYDEETYNCDYTYTLNFSKFTTVKFDLPVEVTPTVGLYANTTDVVVALGSALDEVKALISLTYKSEEGSTLLTDTDYSVTGLDSYNGNVAGTYQFTYTYLEYSVTVKVTVRSDNGLITDSSDAEGITEISKKDFYYEGEAYNVNVGIPSEGDVKVLVFPIEFTNYTSTSNDYKDYKNVLEKAFNGTSQDTGWESLKSYYNKVSYGKLNITATIMDSYKTGDKFNKNATVGDYDYEIILELLEYYDSQIDYSDYDANNDGYIDCIYIVYLAPYDEDGADDSCWWAYTYEFYEEEEEAKFDNKGIDYYLWFSYDFFNDSGEYEIDCDINTVTIIHETGHALGINDYYDYEEGKGPEGGLGGCDMMDYNQGDHNPWSKAILGWISPEVISGYQSTYTKTLASFGSSGDCIVIAKNWNGTWFDEFYIIDYRTVDGVNAASKNIDGQFSISGVTIYHVDGTLAESPESIWYITEFDNSSTKHKQIAFVEADGNNSIEKTYYVSDSDLFQAGDSVANLKWYDGSSIGYTISIDSINSNGATISVTPNSK